MKIDIIFFFEIMCRDHLFTNRPEKNVNTVNFMMTLSELSYWSDQGTQNRCWQSRHLYFIPFPVHKTWTGFSVSHPFHCPLSEHQTVWLVLSYPSASRPWKFHLHVSNLPRGFISVTWPPPFAGRQANCLPASPNPRWLITDTMSARTAGKAILWSEAFDWGWLEGGLFSEFCICRGPGFSYQTMLQCPWGSMLNAQPVSAVEWWLRRLVMLIRDSWIALEFVL